MGGVDLGQPCLLGLDGEVVVLGQRKGGLVGLRLSWGGQQLVEQPLPPPLVQAVDGRRLVASAVGLSASEAERSALVVLGGGVLVCQAGGEILGLGSRRGRS